ncbi:Acetyltransferase (GNAT) family protein [Mycolicibacterium neoaurum]|uniref:Acetyltransferase (GNAT) family protein n=2 Tax=Mycobacteriaceae TaxID=1762 RepID=A0AAV2WKD5_MYCNE|nr:Acetyltransferase (GNAT) family protein [Mycolicibacterium neoaurum]
MRIRRMVRADWQWIAPWFDDDELCHRLGPLDEEWLEHVLAEHEGVQLVVTDIDGAPIGLVGCAWDPGGVAHAITDLAVCPWRRRVGLGRDVLSSVLTWDGHPRARRWVAFVDPDNRAASEFFAAVGWHLDGLDDEMYRFSRDL